MNEIPVSAKTLDDAITEASIQLGVASDQMEYDVIEKGSAGFLGIGSRQAVIRARIKKTVTEEIKAEEIKPEEIKKEAEERLSYVVESESGPDHDKHFVVAVRFNSDRVARGEGRSKKMAEQHAAREALKLLGVIKDEMLIIADKYGDDRRTSIGYDVYDLSTEDLIPVEDVVIAMTHLGYIKRMDVDNFRSQNRGGKGINPTASLSSPRALAS